MGNSHPGEKSDSPLKSFIPPNRNPKSRIINDMMQRAVRKIEEDHYFSDENQYPSKTVYFEQPISNSDFKQRPSNKHYGQGNSFENVNNENEDSSNKDRTSSTVGKGNSRGYYGELVAPRGAEQSNNNFFISQKKLSVLKSGKALNSKKTFTFESKRKSDASQVLPDNYSSYNSKLGQLISPTNIQEENEAEGIKLGNDKQSIMKKILVNCSLEKKLFSLPDMVQFHIFSFLLADYPQLILVSSVWYFKVNGLFDDYMVPVDNSFIKAYMDILAFKRSYFSIFPYNVGPKRCLRMDRNIIAEVMPALQGKSVTFGYTYEVTNKRGTQYKATYKFDCVKRGKRNIWIYKEESNHANVEKFAFVQPIIPVSVQDNIKFAINFYNLSGLVDVNTIEWKPPILELTPILPKEIQTNFLDGVDRNRICELEEMYSDWISIKYADNKNKFEYDFFHPHLSLKETKIVGSDTVSIKSLYTAVCPGEVDNSMERLGVAIDIYPTYEDIIVEVKRMGLFVDLESFLQLRVGDRLIFYCTRYAE